MFLWQFKSNVKERIICILTNNFALTFTGISKLVKLECRISSQGVYKALKELVRSKVVVKNNSKTYSLSNLWVSKIKQMEMSISNTHENNWENEGVFGEKNPRIPSKYCFKEDHIAVNGISSILLPKAFLQETINCLNELDIKNLSIKIADYYFQSLEKSLPDLKNNKRVCSALKSFNELLQDFYWGSISFHAGKKDEIIYLKINSNNFSSKKLGELYFNVNTSILEKLGYKLLKKDTLKNMFAFKNKKSF